MIRIILASIYLLVCASAILTFVAQNSATVIDPNTGLTSTVGPPEFVSNYKLLSFVILLFLSQTVTLIDFLVPKKRVETISSIFFGLLIGFLLSYVLVQALGPALADSQFRGIMTVLVTLVVPYLCISLLIQTRDDFRFIVPYVEFSRELKGMKPLILDSSALIDGRISDVLDTKIIDAQLIAPDFILHEIQDIADSSDKSRRTRGRRGLEVLTHLQKSPEVDLRMMETDPQEYKGMPVDQKLVVLTKKLGGRVVTNDYNLNKVAGVQGVQTINLNDVANALKPRFLPGEHIRIKIIKEGESVGQGVGYLDDGTMVVCEQCSDQLGREVDISVTSVLQSSAGRMIFGKPYDDRNDH